MTLKERAEKLRNIGRWRVGRMDMRSYLGDGTPVHYVYPPNNADERIQFVGDNCVEKAIEYAEKMNEQY